MSSNTRVLILGGGFGGLYAALEFEKRKDPDFDVTLVSHDNFFLFTPMLHEIAASDLDLTIEKKLRVAIDWVLDVFFSKDFVQYLHQRAPTMSRSENQPPPPSSASCDRAAATQKQP